MRLSAPIYRLKRAARLKARDQGIPLHAALDQIAAAEGFVSWSLLSSRSGEEVTDPSTIGNQLQPGDLVLIAARPRQGKTLLALQMATAAAGPDQKAYFFSLDCTPAEVRTKLDAINMAPTRFAAQLVIDCSDDICADYVMQTLDTAPRGTLAVIDYLQLLDQKRSTPALQQQVTTLAQFARTRGLVIAFICQVDRAFEMAEAPMPDLDDIRLPNPLDLTIFDHAWFLNKGTVHGQRIPKSQAAPSHR